MGNDKRTTPSKGVATLSLGVLIGLTVAFFGTVRSIPTIASTGWMLFLYFGLAAFAFAVPIALVSAEMATSFKGNGGQADWVSRAFGRKWGMVSSWFVWGQMFFGMVMLSTTLPNLFSYVIYGTIDHSVPVLVKGKWEHEMIYGGNIYPLYKETSPGSGVWEKNQHADYYNNLINWAFVIGFYWIITLLNMKYDLAKIIGRWGAIIGVYVPFAFILLVGIIYLGMYGFDTKGNFMQGPDNKPWANDKNKINQFSRLVGIIFIFAGVEISSVFAKRAKNKKRDYPIAVIAALFIIMLLNFICSFGVGASSTNSNDIINISQPMTNMLNGIFAHTHGHATEWINGNKNYDTILKGNESVTWMTNIISLCIFLGVISQLSAWAAGPVKAMATLADEGEMPPALQKRNKIGVPINLVLIQAIAISVVSLVLLIPGIDLSTTFLMFTVATTVVYAAAYVLILLAAIRLRYCAKDVERVFRIGKENSKYPNLWMWVTAIIGLIAVIGTIAISFVPPWGAMVDNSNATSFADTKIKTGMVVGYVLVMILAPIILGAVAFIFNALKKPEWVNKEWLASNKEEFELIQETEKIDEEKANHKKQVQLAKEENVDSVEVLQKKASSANTKKATTKKTSSTASKKGTEKKASSAASKKSATKKTTTKKSK